MNDSLTKHVVLLAVLCATITGVAFLAVDTKAALCCAILSLVVFVFFLVVSLRRRAEIRRLTDEIDEVLNLGRRLSFSNCREGDIAVLANELEKMWHAFPGSPARSRARRPRWQTPSPTYRIRSARR